MNAPDKNGPTPLHPAVWNTHHPVIEILIQFPDTRNARDEDRWTPLHLAAWNDDVRTIQILLRAGSDVSACDLGRLSVLNLAAMNRSTDAIKEFLEPTVPEPLKCNHCYDTFDDEIEYHKHLTFKHDDYPLRKEYIIKIKIEEKFTAQQLAKFNFQYKREV